MNRREFARSTIAAIAGTCLLAAAPQATKAGLLAADPWVTCLWQSGTPWTVKWLKVWSYHPALSGLSDSDLVALCRKQEKRGQIYTIEAKARESAMKNLFGPDRERWHCST